MGSSAFYLPLGDDRYVSTEHTGGPWSPDSQHMGPPSGLLTRELERVPTGLTDTGSGVPPSIARITVEILGPVPVAELRVRSSVQRSGRSVELLSAELSAGSRPVARALAWRLTGTDTRAVAAGAGDPLPSPEQAEPQFAKPEGWLSGYLDAMELLSVRGGLGPVGPATLWLRQRVPLVDGEPPSGLQRLMTVADTGNGASNRLDLRHWLFINTELTVHIWRVPTGEWIGLDADTAIGPNGVGTATSKLHDTDGPVGRGAQALLVRPR
ncbi:MAG TPA: thioesterase family protein [Pseudonocardiaceae bacterium]|jgi:hypothetical protein|nr:thioesterase family protein [Pseudonocardiaceae bacterium]